MDKPGATSDLSSMPHSVAHIELDRRKLEEFRDRASDLEKQLGKGWRVEAHPAWKGVAMTLHVPRELLPKD